LAHGGGNGGESADGCLIYVGIYLYVPSGVYKTGDWEGKTSRTRGTQDGRDRGAKVVVDAFLAWWSLCFFFLPKSVRMDGLDVRSLLINPFNTFTFSLPVGSGVTYLVYKYVRGLECRR
jgi:hypothetical protein